MAPAAHPQGPGRPQDLFHIEYVIGDSESEESPFAYTVGLFGLHHPELLIFGLSPSGASYVLNELARRVHGGAGLTPGAVITMTKGGPDLVPEAVPNPGRIVFTANRHYRRPDERSVPVLQLSWADAAGAFPWEAHDDLPEWLQPRPGTFSA
jgi:hypothetical protein